MHIQQPNKQGRRAQNRMTRDVLAHLRAISAQQSKIRGLRNKLVILREAAARHVDALGEFRAVRAAAAAYSQCLAECMRRCAAVGSRCILKIEAISSRPLARGAYVPGGAPCNSVEEDVQAL